MPFEETSNSPIIINIHRHMCTLILPFHFQAHLYPLKVSVAWRRVTSIGAVGRNDIHWRKELDLERGSSLLLEVQSQPHLEQALPVVELVANLVLAGRARRGELPCLLSCVL